jgi:hypothetical protein
VLENNQEKQIFYPKLWWRLLPIPVLIVGAWQCCDFYFTFRESRMFSSFVFLLILLFFTYACFVSYVFSCKTRLIVSADGLQLEGIYIAKVSWNELLEISSSPYSQLGMPRIHTWGLTYHSKAGKHKEFLPLGHIIPRPQHTGVEMLIVLMGIDWEKFKATEFGQILYEQAPQLFPEN